MDDREPNRIDDIEHRLRTLATTQLTEPEITVVRGLITAAFGSDEDERFTDDDWEHALGGTHFVLDVGGKIVSHAAVVERAIHLDGQPFRTGYVEAVATAADRQGRGFGSIVMAAVGEHIRERFELGALGTGRQSFYERLGWTTWRGPSAVRMGDGTEPTPEDDGYIMVLATPTSPSLDRDKPISCEWRPGDVW